MSGQDAEASALHWEIANADALIQGISKARRIRRMVLRLRG